MKRAVANLRITIMQTTLHWEDVDANLKMLSAKLASVTNTDLIVLPEMFSTGFSMNAARFADTMDGKTVSWMRSIASQKQCCVCGSVMIAEGGRYYNRFVWMRSDGEYQLYNKRHLFSLSGEEKVFSPGNERLIVELNGWKICPLVCYDLRFPVWSRNKNSEYDLLIYVANWPERRVQAWKYLLIARAIENQSYVAGINRVGNDGNDVYHSGDSMVVHPNGTVLYHKEQDEDIATIELSKVELDNFRGQFSFLADADDFVINPKSKFKSH